MSISERENYLRNVSMTGPKWMPCHLYISPATWHQLREELKNVLIRHPTLFPDFAAGIQNYNYDDLEIGYRENEIFTDSWGCKWENRVKGLDAVVISHPLDIWKKLNNFKTPNPL